MEIQVGQTRLMLATGEKVYQLKSNKLSTAQSVKDFKTKL